MVKERQSNIELLRILSMLMVVCVHTFTPPHHLQYLTFGDLSVLDYIDLYREVLCISCVNIFILISGYFSIKWNLRSFISLIFQVYFWIFIVYAFCLAVGITEFSINGLFHHLCGIFWDYWFVPAYIGLYILSPIINSFVEKSKPGKLVVYLVCFYIFQLACQCFQPSYFNCGYSMLSFVGLYIIGRYIKVTGVVDEIKNRKELAALVLLVTLLIVLCGIAGCTILKKNGTDLTTYHIPFTFTYNNPLIVIQSILIFLFFLKLDIKSKFINWCAISSFSIYLLHMHTDLKQHFYAITDSWYEYPLYLHYCLIIMTMIVVSVVAIPVDKLRITCFNILYNKISKILTK